MNESTVIALGFFDGVHIGHGELLKMAVRRAQERGCRSAAFTFDRSPREFVTGKPVPLLTTPSERANIIRTQYGVQEVFVEPFDQSMMTMPWEDFISELLVRKYHAVHLVAGHDFRFGHKNEGDVEKLKSYCAAHGLGCDIIPRVEKDGVTVSSTYIRSLLEAGEVRRAAEFLGHYFSVEGTVRHGEGIGKKSLFPTANLIPEHRDDRDISCRLRWRPVRAEITARLFRLPARGEEVLLHAGAARHDRAKRPRGRNDRQISINVNERTGSFENCRFFFCACISRQAFSFRSFTIIPDTINRRTGRDRL